MTLLINTIKQQYLKKYFYQEWDISFFLGHTNIDLLKFQDGQTVFFTITTKI